MCCLRWSSKYPQGRCCSEQDRHQCSESFTQWLLYQMQCGPRVDLELVPFPPHISSSLLDPLLYLQLPTPVEPCASNYRGDTALTGCGNAVKAHKGIKASCSARQSSGEAIRHKAPSPIDACSVLRRWFSEIKKTRHYQPLHRNWTFW